MLAPPSSGYSSYSYYIHMKNYQISGTEFPNNGETARAHNLVVDMDKNKPSIFTLTQGSSAPGLTKTTPRSGCCVECWKRHSVVLSIVFLVLFILALIAVIVLAVLYASYVSPLEQAKNVVKETVEEAKDVLSPLVSG